MEIVPQEKAENKVGFFLVDKARGINSFKLVMALRRVLSMKRVGFAGTLDPLATGLMILAIGEYTKLLPYLESADKAYDVTVQLDGISDTYDMEGQITQLDPKSYTRPSLDLVNKLIEQKFLGKIQQIPPKFSAIQIDGKRAYDMARKGQEFELKARTVEIFSIKVVEYDFPKLKLTVHCSSGTYIRSIAFDLGRELGVGGYVTELRRTSISATKVENAHKIEDIDSGNWKNLLVKPEDLLSGMQQLKLNDEDYLILARGNFVDTIIYSMVKLDLEKPIMAIYKGEIVGILETLENGQKLKFKKKLNIF